MGIVTESTGGLVARRPLASLAASWIAGIVLLFLLAPSASAEAKPKPCADAQLVPTGPAHIQRVQRATRCLVNRARRAHGMPKLQNNVDLLKSSEWQAQDMREHEYFDHSRPDGPEFLERIARFGYGASGAGFSVGENIAWASSPIATPKQIVKLWLDSPSHRRNMLTRGYKDQAVAALWVEGPLSGDYEASGGPFVIYVNQFGRTYQPITKR